MLTFLRKIRFRLLGQATSEKAKNSVFDSGVVGKYLFYAFGEVMLVMIGILLALQVNIWNQKKIDRQREQIYLMQFDKDLTASLKEIERVRQKSSFVSSLADSLLALSRMDNPTYNQNFIDSAMTFIAGWTRCKTQDGAVNDIVGAGNLGLISDPIVRSSIASWHSNFEMTQDREEGSKSAAKEVAVYLEGIIDFSNIDIRTSLVDLHQVYGMLNDIQFRNYLSNTKMFSKILSEDYTEHYARIDHLRKKVIDQIRKPD